MRFIKNKKGIAIELALMAIVLMVAFCAVLISVVSMHRLTELHTGTDVAYDVACSQVGEDFVAAVKAGNAADFAVEQFVVNGKAAEELPVAEVDVSGDAGSEQYLMTLYDAGHQEVLLKVGVKIQDGNCVLTKWGK